ncbi:MAG: HAMP domain-containing protein [Burkholderiaceae bacterium]|nr:HAMP domain-containing protein [Burkholderiaceae bacterium]
MIRIDTPPPPGGDSGHKVDYHLPVSALAAARAPQAAGAAKRNRPIQNNMKPAAASRHLATGAPLPAWLRASLERRLTVGLCVAVLLSALVLVVLAQSLNRRALVQEQETAAMRLAQVFEASLQHAMLRRDVPGMASILARMGQAPGVARARLLEPHGTVRFAANAADVGTQDAQALAGLCVTAGCAVPAPRLRWRDGDGNNDAAAAAAPGARPALQIAYPIHNQARCQQCHGPVATHPVNGVLLLDFQALPGMPWRDRATLLSAGLAALLVFAGIMAWTLRRQVTQPLYQLLQGSEKLASGDWSTRLHVAALDELGRVAQGFNRMADRLGRMMGALQQQHTFLQTLIDAVPDPLLVIDANFRIRLANRAYGNLLGLDTAAIVGSTCHQTSRGLREPCPCTLVTCPVAEMRQQAQPVHSVMRLRRADGGQVEADIEAALVESASGERLTVEILRPLDRTVRFSQEQRLSTIGLLANGVAHEIHNPLASIRLALQACLRGLRGGDISNEELMDYLGVVDHEIDRCVLTTRRLMQMSAVPSQTLGPVRVLPAIHDVLALLGEECRAAGVAVSRQCAPAEACILGDEAEFRQVLINLIHNALHATPAGGYIEIRATQEGSDRLRLQVQDSGSGIALADQALIFMPFFSRRADGQRGTGLGLAISKSIVDRFGGEISVRSTPGQGATFTVLLPLAASAPPSPPSGAAASAAASSLLQGTTP